MRLRFNNLFILLLLARGLLVDSQASFERTEWYYCSKFRLVSVDNLDDCAILCAQLETQCSECCFGFTLNNLRCELCLGMHPPSDPGTMLTKIGYIQRIDRLIPKALVRQRSSWWKKKSPHPINN